MTPQQLLQGVQKALSQIELGENDRIELRFVRIGQGQAVQLTSLGGLCHPFLTAMCPNTGRATVGIVEDERPGVPIQIQGHFAGLDPQKDAERIQAISLVFEAATNFIRTNGHPDCTIDYRHMISTEKPGGFKPRINFIMDGMPPMHSDSSATLRIATSWDLRSINFK
ncbi:MAG: hypothetical protein PHY34_02635 [Patescibacteria group bacterium]|nr:hypothetical protein [Patescibacteria group bacterium]MDD5715459.1 hypothetical protein [Patescibacteria group bacterium]